MRLRAFLFLGSLGILLLVLVTGLQYLVLPSGLAGRIGHNSEALAFALVTAGVIHAYRHRLERAESVKRLLVPTAFALAVTGLLLQRTGWASSVVTLNESLLGVAFVSLYLCLPRARLLAGCVALATLTAIIVFFDTNFVLDQAESLVPLVIAPLSLDLFDRTVLQPRLQDRPWLRTLWMVALVAIALGAMVAAQWARQDLHGPLRMGIDYAQRAAEAYWGWLLIHFYFSVWLGKHWRDREVSS